MIADILLTIACIGFICADFKQAYKLWKHYEFDTEAFSKTHFRLKIFSLIMVITAYIILNTHFALTVSIIQLFVNLYIIKRINGLCIKK